MSAGDVPAMEEKSPGHSFLLVGNGVTVTPHPQPSRVKAARGWKPVPHRRERDYPFRMSFL